MDERSALIIGTSHSFGACIREENNDKEIFDPYIFEDRVKHPNRWQDNLEKHNYKVTTFARAGCTAQQQLDAFYHYINDNPDLHWDLIIIEGRDPESTVAYPSDESISDSKQLWSHWLLADKDNVTQAEREVKKFNINNLMLDFQLPKTEQWYKEYVWSHLHLIDVWSVNSALCSLASNYAKVVKWFTFGGEVVHDKEITTKSINLQIMFIGKYCIKNTLPALQRRKEKSIKNIFYHEQGKGPRCHCGHLNELGHKLLWDDVLELALLEEGVL
jgi:hypothetical protein